MLNIEHIICEYADERGLPYGKAESLLMGKLKIAARKGGQDFQEVLTHIEGLTANQVAIVAEAVSTGKPPAEIFNKNSVDSSVDKEYKGTMNDNTSNIGGPKMTTKEKFARLNELRVAANMKPLKAWKESKAKLDAAINKLDSGKGPKPEEHPDPIQVHKDAKKMGAQKTKSIKGGKKKDAAPKKDASKGDTISVGQLCEELGINAKVARAKLRRLAAKDDNFPQPISDQRWVWNIDDKKALIKLLS